MPEPAAPVEQVVLLDDEGRPVGAREKRETHTDRTPLHLAFSLYLFDDDGRFLATRRALGKQAWAGVWTNSCCGHPAPGEDLVAAAHRRAGRELGAEVRDVRLVLPDYRYRAVSPEGVVEHELCPVLVGRVRPADLAPAPDEVVEHRWVGWERFVDVARTAPWLISPWSAEQAPQVAAVLGGSVPAV